MRDVLRMARAGWRSDERLESVAAVVIVLVVFAPAIARLWRSYKVARGVKTRETKG